MTHKAPPPFRRPRSVYANRLAEYADMATADEAIFARQGGWHAFFRGRIGPQFNDKIVCEIGCNDASLLARVAGRHPQTAFVGLDWKCKALYDAAVRVTTAGLSNVALLRGRGQDIASIFAPGELDAIWIFHPDPCDRDVERPNRLFQESFLLAAHYVLHAAGHLCLKTDHPGYYQHALALLGRPQPAWFEPARLQQDGTNKPRVRWRDLVAAPELPPASEAVNARFEVVIDSTSYWDASLAFAPSVVHLFADEMTPFEQRFVAKGQPIYFLDLKPL